MWGRVIGLDLGSHSLKLVELRTSLRQIEVARVQAVPALPDPDAALAALDPAAFAGARVVCAIASPRLTRRVLRFPFRSRKRLAQAVPFEIENETPFAIEDVVVDYELLPSAHAEAEVAAALVRREEVASRLEQLQAVGISPRVMEGEGLCLANLEGFRGEEEPHVIADLGHRKTTLCLVVDGHPRAARTLPFGGTLLTQAIADELGCPMEEAERAKCSEGIFERGLEVRYSRAAAVLDNLARDMVRALTSFEPILAGPAEEQLRGLTLVGGTARLPRLDAYLRERTGISTRRLEFPPQAELGEFAAAGDPVLFAPALALAARGTARARTRTNFLQGEFAPRFELTGLGPQFRWTGRLAAAALGLALVSGATQLAVADRQADRLEAQMEELWGEVAPGQPLPRSIPGALRDTLRDARDRADQLGLYGGNLSALGLLTEISRKVPAELSLIFEELSIDGQVVRIRGHTPSFAAVDQLQAALSDDPHFGEIRVSEIQADSNRGGNTFSLTIRLAQGATP
jgi:type IV pilus assembly protein PilM